MPQATATVADPADESSPGLPADARGTAAGSDFAPLLRVVRDQGLLERRTDRYVLGIAVNLAALGAMITGFVLLGDTWWSLLLTLPLAVLWTRTAFVAHDAGHAQISGDRRTSRLIGLVHANLLLGMNEAWWNDKHVRHHANPNHIDKDPDVGVGALVWTQKQAAQREGFARWLTRNQARLFFPMLLLEGIALKIYGFQFLRRQPCGSGPSRRCCSPRTSPSTRRCCSARCPRERRSSSLWCCTRCSDSTWAWPSPRTTRGWRCPTPTASAGVTSSGRS